jgi:site-specific DNA recombinase
MARPLRGDRRVNDALARVVTRIFNDYAQGKSSRSIARALNHEGGAGPSGKPWGMSTIHGNRERGTGILNNELYIGKLVWNRLRYMKDPDTGKRVSRLNPQSQWIVKSVPELRIINQALWDSVKARQGDLISHRDANTADGFWDRRRPRYLFSGLLKCGTCGGGLVKISKDHFGCATARNKGTCANLISIKREDLEATVLDGLQHHLMDPALCEVFAEEYTRHMNRLRSERNATLEGHRAELVKVRKDIDRVIEAIIDGVLGSQVKDKMARLEERKQALEALLDSTERVPVSVHRAMGKYYRKQVGRCARALNDPRSQAEAVALLRTLVDRMVLTPEKIGGKRQLTIDLIGALAGILSLSAGSKKAVQITPDGLEAMSFLREG